MFDISFTAIQRSGLRLRRLANLLGCRDPEYTSPSQSRSDSPAVDLDDDLEVETNSAAYTEDENEEV